MKTNEMNNLDKLIAENLVNKPSDELINGIMNKIKIEENLKKYEKSEAKSSKLSMYFLYYVSAIIIGILGLDFTLKYFPLGGTSGRFEKIDNLISESIQFFSSSIFYYTSLVMLIIIGVLLVNYFVKSKLSYQKN